MTTTAGTLIGHLTEVRGNEFVARLLTEDEGFQPIVRFENEDVMVGQIGGYVAAQQAGVHVVGLVARTWQEDPPIGTDEPGTTLASRRFIAMMPVGQIDERGHFQRGVHRFPTTGAELHAMDSATLSILFEQFRKLGFDVGHLPSRPEAKVYLDPSPMFGRHLAILGQSGAGKSWTVSALMQRMVQVMPRCHVIVLDLHGEYAWKDEKGNLQMIFPPGIARYVDARELEIPYWLLTFAELADLLIDRADPRASVQIAFLREVVFSLRKKANADLGLERLSVDSPVFFNLMELFLHFKKANEQQLDFGKTKGALFGQFDEFLIKLQSKLNDARYDFLFKPKNRNESSTLINLLRDFVGLGRPHAQVTIIDLSPIPSDVRPRCRHRSAAWRSSSTTGTRVGASSRFCWCARRHTPTYRGNRARATRARAGRWSASPRRGASTASVSPWSASGPRSCRKPSWHSAATTSACASRTPTTRPTCASWCRKARATWSTS
jgi:hypothetical protein